MIGSYSVSQQPEWAQFLFEDMYNGVTRESRKQLTGVESSRAATDNGKGHFLHFTYGVVMCRKSTLNIIKRALPILACLKSDQKSLEQIMYKYKWRGTFKKMGVASDSTGSERVEPLSESSLIDHSGSQVLVQGPSTIAAFISNQELKFKRIRKGSNKKPTIWTCEQINSLKVYLQKYGSDFTIIATFMNKSRDQIKRKFKSFEKKDLEISQKIFMPFQPRERENGQK